MKNIVIAVLLIFALVLGSCSNQREGKPRVLVFSKTMGYKHGSIPSGIAAIQKLGVENGFEVDTTKNAALFTEENLEKYSSIIFLSTTLNVFDARQEAVFERYIQSGGGFVGVHAAADTEYDWGWYTKLVGAQFESHPSGTPEADFIIKDADFSATKHFNDSVWHRADEIYNYKKINPDVNVLITVDESSYEGGKNGDSHPFAWYHDFDGGRAFYTGAGHTSESYKEVLFLQHLLGGIQYAIGDNLNLDYSKARSQVPPEADRFSKITLKEGEFFEPTEMTILPNNDVLVAERRGTIKVYKETSKELKEVASFSVYDKTQTPGVNAEEGIMGLQKDPNYASNNWVYVYFSPAGDTWVNRLSRFKFKDDIFDMASEQVILDVASDREVCCHTGGSIAFDSAGLLYLSTGDNSTPFDEKGAKYVNRGYAPLNDMPGKKPFDARRSAGNTNDLRGKILRIKVNEDGTYSIPEDNLFAVGTEKTRPEIYTMGHRNPYRISVDQKNGYVYWGEIGPDARVDDMTFRGPRGYDEMGQAREAGNFGWPLFVGDNKPYVDYDYETGESGLAFDAEKPINESKNNTGLVQLPKAMPAYAYYPYGATTDFPQLGNGGRNAMAGPTYYSDLYTNGGRLPAYYDGKVIIYDWMRGWMMAVTNFEDGTFNKMEPFATDIEINSLIDMELGPNGRLYLLEYGSGWFSKNENSSLGYIEFNGGNRPPVIKNITVDKTSGKLPISITATVDAIDSDSDDIRYIWNLGNGETQKTNAPTIRYSYTNAGAYNISVVVEDGKGKSAESKGVAIVAGNSRPEVAIKIIDSNSSFFVPGQSVGYEVSVADAESTEIDPSTIFVSVDYLDGMDKVAMSLGHQQVSATVTGKALTQAMDCKVCHKELGASIGPSYTDVAKKYKEDINAMSYLQNKIVEGGSGVWGEVMMAAHPNLTSNETYQIASYIMSLSKDASTKISLAPKGIIATEMVEPDNVMVITASYTDGGAEGAAPLTGFKSVTLATNTIFFSDKINVEGIQTANYDGKNVLLLLASKGWFELDTIDLTDVKTINISTGWEGALTLAYDFEVRVNAPDGEVIGKARMNAPSAGSRSEAVPVSLTKSIDAETTLYITYAVEKGKKPAQLTLDRVRLN